MAYVTVFTPTYNRAHTLHRCYNSLIRQSCKDFIWLIVDDGSTDNTRSIVDGFIAENKIRIKYIHQENGGVHRAHNTAHSNLDSILCVLCDSDDYLSDKAIEYVIDSWEKHGSDDIGGLIGLDALHDDTILTSIPSNIFKTTLYDLRYRYNIRGDFKLVYRSDLLKTQLYPEIENEKYFPISYKYFKLDQEYSMIVINKILCFIEYMPDGISLNRIKLFKQNPVSYSIYRKFMMDSLPSGFLKFKQIIHYVSSCILSKNLKSIFENKYVFKTLLALPFGLLLAFFISVYPSKR